MADRRALVRGRVAVALLFLSYGTILGAWTARIPAIKHGIGLTDGQLSVGLLTFAAGAITGMQLAGRVVDRYGSDRLMIPAALIDAVVLITPAFANGLVTLALGLYLFGTVHGTLNVAMNTNAVDVQRAWGRPIISSLHAVYSVGGFLGAAIGGALAYAEIGAAATFLAVAGAVVLVVIWAARWVLPVSLVPPVEPDPAQAMDGPARSPSSESAGVTFLGVLVFCCLVGEGAAADWSAVYLRDSLASTAGFAAAAYAAFSIMMMLGRLVGDGLTARLGPVRLVRGCGILAAVGLAAALLVGHPIAGVIGFGCLGAGLSCIAPQVFSAAGTRNPARAGHAIARVASLGFLGFVIGPVMIGAVAELAGLPAALVIPAVLALFVAVAAPALRPRAERSFGAAAETLGP